MLLKQEMANFRSADEGHEPLKLKDMALQQLENCYTTQLIDEEFVPINPKSSQKITSIEIKKSKKNPKIVEFLTFVMMKTSKSEENGIATCLRKAFKSVNLESEAIYLKKMGNIYLERGKVTEDGMDFVKAAGLYNASFARCSAFSNKEQEEEIKIIQLLECKEMVELEFTVGCLARKLTPYSFKTHQRSLESIRNRFSLELKNLIKEFPVYEEYDEEKDIKLIQQKRNEGISQIYQEITQDMIAFIQVLIRECLNILGLPPCEFAFIGLGSLATGVMTPYSDLEGAILLEEGKDSEENKQYFRKLTYLLYIKTVNLGETVLPTLCIESLCEPDGYTNWFNDFITPRGFSMDGQVPWASKTPLGRKATNKFPALELIGTPLQISHFCADDDILLQVGYDIPNALTKTILIEGNERLHQQYKDILKNKLIEDKDFIRKHSLLKMYSTIKKFGIRKQFESNIIHRKSDIKRDVYRLPSLIIAAAGIYYRILDNDPWAIVKRMEREGKIGKEIWKICALY